MFIFLPQVLRDCPNLVTTCVVGELHNPGIARGRTPMRLCCWRDDLETWKLLIAGSFTGVEDCDFDEVWGNCGGG